MTLFSGVSFFLSHMEILDNPNKADPPFLPIWLNIQCREEKQRKRGWQSSTPEESVILAENKNSWSLASHWAWGRKFSWQTSEQKFFYLHLITKDQHFVRAVVVHISTLPNLTDEVNPCWSGGKPWWCILKIIKTIKPTTLQKKLVASIYKSQQSTQLFFPNNLISTYKSGNPHS